MEYILKKLKSLKQGESWDYGNSFVVKKEGVSWVIRKHGIEVITSSCINDISKEIKLTFIALDILKDAFKEDGLK